MGKVPTCFLYDSANCWWTDSKATCYGKLSILSTEIPYGNGQSLAWPCYITNFDDLEIEGAIQENNSLNLVGDILNVLKKYSWLNGIRSLTNILYKPFERLF